MYLFELWITRILLSESRVITKSTPEARVASGEFLGLGLDKS